MSERLKGHIFAALNSAKVMLVIGTKPEYSDLFEKDVFKEIDLKICVSKRISEGGTGPDSVTAQIKYIRSI